MLEKNIQLSEIMLHAMQLDDDSNGEHADALANIKRRLIVREYAPVKDKNLALIKAIMRFSSDNDIIILGLEQAVNIEVFGLIELYTNIENDLVESFSTIDIIDFLEPTGLLEEIEKVCARDYTKLKEIYNNAINWNVILSNRDQLEKLTPETAEELAKTLKEFQEKTKSEDLERLGMLLNGIDPLAKATEKMFEQKEEKEEK